MAVLEQGRRAVRHGSDSTLPNGWESSPGTQTAPTPTGSTGGCGGSSTSSNPEQTDGNGHSYQSVGFQSLVNIIRGTGAQNVIQVPGIAFADALTCTNTGSPVTCGFLQSGIKLTDPLATSDPSLGQQLMADMDNYPDVGQFVNSVTTMDDTYGPVEQVMPIDCGECGVEGNPASFPLIEAFMNQYESWGRLLPLAVGVLGEPDL